MPNIDAVKGLPLNASERPLRPDWSRPRSGVVVAPDATAAHAAAMAQELDGYFDPHSGLFVMTASGLAHRGYCCDNDCRHCPYERP